MWRGAAIGIDDDLAAGQSGIAIRASDHELAGRIDVEFAFVAHPAARQNTFNERPHELPHFFLRHVFRVLG